MLRLLCTSPTWEEVGEHSQGQRKEHTQEAVSVGISLICRGQETYTGKNGQLGMSLTVARTARVFHLCMWKQQRPREGTLYGHIGSKRRSGWDVLESNNQQLVPAALKTYELTSSGTHQCSGKPNCWGLLAP